MRILHVIHRYPPAIGGGELWCAGLARWQVARGHAVRVLTLRAVEDDALWGERVWSDDPLHALPLAAGPVALGEHDRQDGVEIRRCRYSRPLYGLARLLARARLDGLSWGNSAEFHGLLLREARWADVIHGYWLSGAHALAACVAAHLARRPFVLTPFFHHGFAYHESRAARALLRRADRIIALTEFEAEALSTRGARPERIVCAGNAIQPRAADPDARARVRRALGLGLDVPLVCYIGRKAPGKGLEVLLQAIARLDGAQAPWLTLAGPSTDWYRALLAASPRTRVLDLPPVSEAAKADLLAAAELLVLPSKLESFGTVFLEAWAMGTAVVGADVPAVREVVGDAGLTFRPDDAADLAARIASLIATPELRQRLTARGAQRVAEHSWDRLGSAVLAAYLGTGARRRPGTVGALENQLPQASP